MLRTVASGLLLGAVLCTATPAHAQGQNAAEADRLFAESKALAEAGRHAEACPMLERSLALDPAIGTEYNLADCQEHVGHLASAWTHYRNVQRDARRAGKSEREAAAKARMNALAPRVGWLRVWPGRYAPAAFTFEVDGVVVTLPGREPGGSDPSLPLDPGSHALRAKGGVDVPWQKRVEIRAGATDTVRPFDTKPSQPTAQRNLAFVIGGVGLAGLLVGGSAAIASAVAHGDAAKNCPDPEVGCPSAPPNTRASAQESVDAWQRATTAGNVATVGFVVGGVALATAVVLFVTAPRDKRAASTALQLSPGGLRF